MIHNLCKTDHGEAHAEPHEAPHVGNQLQVGHNLVMKVRNYEGFLDEDNNSGKVVFTVSHESLLELFLLSLRHVK